jgi:hypothetical protein
MGTAEYIRNVLVQGEAPLIITSSVNRYIRNSFFIKKDKRLSIAKTRSRKRSFVVM